MEAEPVQFLWRRFEERLEPARQELARFVGAKSQDLVFVTNATAGVNAVLRSLKFRRGDELLTTNHDSSHFRRTEKIKSAILPTWPVLGSMPWSLKKPIS
jgi:isopenicillin-N epimerase